MGRTNEFTLIADADFTGKLGYAVVVKNTMLNNTPYGSIVSNAGVAIDGVITDITANGKAGAPVAVGRIGDIVFARLGGTVTVGDKVAVKNDGTFVTQADSAIVVGVALATGASGERIPVLLK